MEKSINTEDKLVPLGNYPAGLIRMMREEGLNLNALLHETNISLEDLDDFSIHISYAQYTQL